MAAYTKAYQKTGKKYIAQMKGDRLEVIRKGKIIPDFVIRQGWQIIDSSYTENTDNMVNQVYIYNSDNQKIGCISNPKWVKRFGVYQDTVSVDSGNGQAEARTELHGIDKSANISMIGEYRCISGLGVIIDDARTNLKGRFWIENDTHEWKNGSYITKLELTFRNIMDIQEEDEEQAEEESGKEENVQDDSDDLNDGQKSDTLEEVLNQARSWIGLGEDPPGSNHNEVTQYYGWDAAWCCMFIWAIFNKTGHGNLFMGGGKTAYCFDVMDYYKARGKFGSTPQKGALVIYGGDGHIGIVESVTGNGWVSIEGNLSNMVKRSNGPSCSTVLGFCYIDYPASANEIKDKPAVTGTAIAVPSSIPQTGIIKDYTNYSYFYSRWTAGTMQRTLANLWGNAGKPSWNGIAILDNYYLVAVRPKFGSVGDRICIVLESGARFNAIIADEKGEDAGNEWGHVYDGRISLIEFESIGNAASNDGAQLNLGPWAGKKVTTVINGGRYAGL